MAPRVLPTAHIGAMNGAARAPRPALGSPVRRGLRRSEKKLGGKFAPSGRCALCSASDQVDLLRRRLEEKQRKYAHRTGQRIFLPAVTWGFSLRCSSSRRTSTQAKKIRGAGTTLTTRTTHEDHERGPRRARRARRARDAEGARHEHEHEHEHGTSTSTSTSTGTSTGTSTSTSTNDSST